MPSKLWFLRNALLYPHGVGQPARYGALARAGLSAYDVLDTLVLRRKYRADYRSEKVLIPGRRLLYVAVPKAASRSLLHFLLGQRERNEVGPAILYKKSLQALFRIRPEARGYFKFTVVRNPWSRVVSVYRQKIRSGDPFIAARLINGRKGLFANMPFDEFVAWLCSEEGADEKADSHWLSQHEILGVQGLDPVCYDFIGRLERLSDDLDILAAKIGMPLSGVGHLLYSGAAESYRTVYTERTAELIGRRYARDIELFGYRFDGAESDGGRSQWPYA